MFPYPSGDGLHVGHPEGYTATDIVCRAARMQGKSVMHPMGFDAFGLPAEEHAIKTGEHPRSRTEKNIDTFRRQGRGGEEERRVTKARAPATADRAQAPQARERDGAPALLASTSLSRDGERIALALPRDRMVLAGEDVQRRLHALADAFGLKPAVIEAPERKTG